MTPATTSLPAKPEWMFGDKAILNQLAIRLSPGGVDVPAIDDIFGMLDGYFRHMLALGNKRGGYGAAAAVVARSKIIIPYNIKELRFIVGTSEDEKRNQAIKTIEETDSVTDGKVLYIRSVNALKLLIDIPIIRNNILYMEIQFMHNNNNRMADSLRKNIVDIIKTVQNLRTLSVESSDDPIPQIESMKSQLAILEYKGEFYSRGTIKFHELYPNAKRITISASIQEADQNCLKGYTDIEVLKLKSGARGFSEVTIREIIGGNLKLRKVHFTELREIDTFNALSKLKNLEKLTLEHFPNNVNAHPILMTSVTSLHLYLDDLLRIDVFNLDFICGNVKKLTIDYEDHTVLPDNNYFEHPKLIP